MLRILHLSDFHYKDRNDIDFKIVVGDICNNLNNQAIDLVVFSGDLVHEDKGVDHYVSAQRVLIDPILTKLNLQRERLLLTPGNHDKTQKGEMSAITEMLAKCNTTKEIEKVLADKRQSDASMVDMTNYLQFTDNFYGEPCPSKFYRTRIVTIGDKQYGLVSINSAWRSFDSIKDRGQLLYPSDEVRAAFANLENCEMIFCTMHHDLSDFKEAVARSMNEVMDKCCDFLFTGHYHQAKTKFSYVNNRGIIHSIAPATYNREDNSSNYGYKIIEIADDGSELREIHYIYQNGSFTEKTEEPLPIPMDVEKRNLIKFSRTIEKRIEEGIEEANDAFLTGYKAQNSGFDFLSMFTQPVLRDKSLQDILMSPSKSKGTQYTVEQITDLKENVVIFGGNKCGKSALLRKLYLTYLQTVKDRLVIPYLINCKEIESDKPIRLKKKLQQFLELNNADFEHYFKKYTLLLLLDDLDINRVKLVSSLKDEMKDFPKVRYIVTTEETVSGQIQLLKDTFGDKSIKRLFFHSVSNKEIHELTKKWPNMTQRKRQDVEASIKKVFKQMHIPLNYWSISLFIWLYDKTDETKIRNNFELIRLYINELLGVDKIVKEKELKIDYDDLLAYLADLAHEILVNGYALKYDHWTSFTREYKNKHKKFTEDIRKVQSTLLSKGVMVEVRKPEEREPLYTYRLKGIFEYFLAYHMTLDAKFKNEVLNVSNYYLSFANEIELYAGFMRKDFDTIKIVFDKTKEIFKPLMALEDFEMIDKQLENEKKRWEINPEDTAILMEEVQKDEDNEDAGEVALFENGDDIINSKVEEKVFYDTIEPTQENLEKALFILSRVFRNSDVCDEEPLGDQILDFILSGTCNLGFLFNKQINQEIKLQQAPNRVQEAINVVSSYIPLVMEAMLFDAISQYNLKKVFEDKLDSLESIVSTNQYKYFLMAFILMDLDMSEYSYILNKIRNNITIPILRYMCHSKCLLMMIKHPSNKELNQPYRQLAIDFSQEFDSKKEATLSIDRMLHEQSLREAHEQTSIKKDYK